MHKLTTILLAASAVLLAAPVSAQQTDEKARIAQLQALMDSLHPVTGNVQVPEAKAMLHLGTDYYFVPAAEAKRIIVDAWSNPPGSADNVLGMVFPKGKTFADEDSWGAVITYDPMGYVSDKDAKDADYAAMLEELQSGEKELNAERAKLGYPAQHLVGWAQTPSYDPKTRSVVWAQNIQFEGQSENTLNYDIRLLGRHGVLSMNMITGMSKLAETRDAAARFVRVGEFTPGSRYADFNPDTDATAEVGVAGLVAAGVGATAAKKLGLFALILAFGKKFFFLIIGAIALLGARFKRLFGFGKEEESFEPAYETAGEPEPAGEQAQPLTKDQMLG